MTMSILARLSRGERTVTDPAPQASLAAGRYMTNGVNLYRWLGVARTVRGRVIGLEDCLSLEVSWLPYAEIYSWRLRPVRPARD